MLKLNIKNYYGIVENGVLAILSIEHDNKFYEGTYWYSKELELMTVEIDLETIIGKIEDHVDYDNYLNQLAKIATPHEQLINVLPKIEYNE
jgi:hypothetical protein